MNLNELRQKRAQLIGEARGLLDRATNGVMSAEDQAQYDRLFDEANKLQDTIKRMEQQAEAEREMGQPATRAAKPNGETGANPQNPRETEEYRNAFNSFLRGGLNGLSAGEHRALQSDVNTSGGYLVTPQQFVNDLIMGIDNQVYIRQWATTFQVPTAQSLGAPSLEADPADPTWTTEIAAVSEDSTMALGKRELYPHQLSKLVKVSNKLLRQVPSSETLVRDRLGYKFAVTMEANYLTGDGNGKPLGVFTASADGIPTSRDVSTDNAATAVTMNGLINAKYALKTQYLARAKWMFHRDGMKQISKLRNDEGGAGTGDYLWQPSTVEGQPDMLLGLPVYASEYVPNTFTSGLYVGILGDFSYYWIADAMDVAIQRLVELYAATNQVGLIGRIESDGMPVLGEAFARVKLG